MEASVRLFNHRHLLRRPFSFPLRHRHVTFSLPPRHRQFTFSLHLPTPNSNSNPQFPNQFQNRLQNQFQNKFQFAHILSSPTQTPFSWHHSVNSSRNPRGGVDSKGPVITAVLLGWLGSQEKHLRRYVELYRSRGIDCVTFVAGVGDVLSFDLGRKLEERIGSLATELADWVSEGGNHRVLMFHTFSNTGWLA